jgi:hypothetical protein
MLIKKPSFIACLDKVHIRNEIDRMPKEKLENMEAEVSRGIIQKYKDEKNSYICLSNQRIIKIRKDYLKKKSEFLSHQIQTNDKEYAVLF